MIVEALGYYTMVDHNAKHCEALTGSMTNCNNAQVWIMRNFLFYRILIKKHELSQKSMSYITLTISILDNCNHYLNIMMDHPSSDIGVVENIFGC